MSAGSPRAGREALLERARLLPGRRLLWLAGLGMLPMLAAPLWTPILYLVAAYDAALLAGMLLDGAGLRRGARLRVRRGRDARLSVGADNPISLTIEHLGDQRVTLWARDAYPAEFEAAGDDVGTNDEVTLGQALRPRLAELGRRKRAWRTVLDEDRDMVAQLESEKGQKGLRRRLARELTPGGSVGEGLALAPGERLDVTYMVTPLRRGDYRFGEVHVRAESWLGLATLAGLAPLAEEARVYPDVQGVKQLGLAARFRDMQALGLKVIRREGGGREFEKLRDYVHGDSLREIDWKATARRNKPITRVFGAERSQTLLLCVDAGRLMAARSGELSKLDHAINAALLLAYSALKGEDRVGLVVFADGVKLFLEPARGAGQYRRILQALYGVEPALCHVDYEAFTKAVLTRVKKRSLVAIFTDLYDRESGQPLVACTKVLRRRHLPLCITQSDDHLEGMRRAVPGTTDALYERAVATEALREREVLKGELAREGAHVLDRPPERLTVDAINAYIELKQRGL